MYDPFTEFTEEILPNGLEVHSVFWDRPWIGVEIVVHTGGREDPVEMPGLAHFLEHMVSKNIPNCEYEEVLEFFETCGGGVNFGSTGYHSTQYKFAVQADIKIFRKALSIIGSMIFEATMKRDLERERQVILSEFNGRYPILEKLKWDMDINNALFKGHRLETYNRPLGRPEGFLSITEEDLQRFHETHYVPANVSLVIVGGIGRDDVMRELKNSPFGINKNGVRNNIPAPLTKIPIPEEQEKIVRASDYSSHTVKLTEYSAHWAFPVDIPRQTRRVFMNTLNRILFQEIREERGLAYGIRAHCENFHDIRRFVIDGRIHPEATDYINEIVQDCIPKVLLRQDLFYQKLQSCKNKCFMTDLSGSDLADEAAQDLRFNQRIISIQEVLDDLNKVEFEQMAECVKSLSPDQQYTFITRP